MTGNPASSQPMIRGGLQLIVLLPISMKGGRKKGKKVLFLCYAANDCWWFVLFIHSTKTIIFWSWRELCS